MKILSIDAWREPEGGWSWNEWFVVGSIDKEAFEALKTNRQLLAYFRKEGYITSQSAGRVAVEDDQFNIVVVERSTRRPLFAIEYGPEY